MSELNTPTPNEPNANPQGTAQQTVPTPEPTPSEPTPNKPEPNKPTESKKEPTQQELLNELARLKRAVDKASSEAADYKKKWKETLSSQEQASMEKAEAEAAQQDKYNAMVRENQIYKYSERYRNMGYSAEDAKRIAEAKADGDTDAEMKIQSEFQAKHDKELKDAWEKQYFKDRPRVNSGVSGETPSITKDEFAKLLSSGKYMEVMEFKEKYPQTYAEYMK